MRIGGVRRALNAEEPCGDAFAWWRDGPLWTICLADGLGHGPDAARASEMALAAAEACGSMPPEEILRSVDDAIRQSRGAAMTIIRIDAGQGTLKHAGIGNVRTALVGAGVSRFEARPGIVGGGCRTILCEEAHWGNDDLLVIWTDGIPAHLDLGPEFRRLGDDPEAIAEQLLDAQGTGRDDVAVVCCRLRRGEMPS